MRRLAIVSTHPIQYYTPWYQALSAHPGIDLTVYYCHTSSAAEQAAAGFGVEFEWDVPLLDGHRYEFLRNVAKMPSTSSFFGLDTPEIFDRIGSEKFDAVIVSGWNYKGAWQTFAACWRHRVPVLVRGDSHLHTRRTLLKRVLKYPAYRLFLRSMSGTMAVGNWSRAYFEHYGVPKERIFFVPHTVDETRFSDESSLTGTQRVTFRERWNIPSDAFVFVLVGKLNANKRPLDFIRAISSAQSRNSSIFGIVVGDGPLRQECEKASIEARANVLFTGFVNQSEMSPIYACCDVLIMTSNSETWGLVVNEVMLSGRPALVSDLVGCGPDLIIPGKTGDIFPMGDVQHLARLMLQYAADPARVIGMGQAARTHVKHCYGIKRAVDGVVHAVGELTR